MKKIDRRGEGESSNTESGCTTWGIEQVLGSLHLYQDWGEVKLVHPEVPDAGELRMPDDTVSIDKWRSW